MHTVNIIIVDDLHDRINNVLTCLRYSWVNVQLATCIHDPVRVLVHHMIASESRLGTGRIGPERVEPRMELHPSGVCLFNHEG
ncbi:hypothetical protein D1872_322560 [compost metagenome]